MKAVYITNEAAEHISQRALADMAAENGCDLRVSVGGELVIYVPAERPVWASKEEGERDE